MTAARSRVSAGAEIQKRLDDFQKSFAGPYRIGDATVTVPAAFRMNGGMKQRVAGDYVARIKAALPPEAYAKVATDLGAVTAGKGTPEQIRRVTQALIDSPVWSSFAPPPPAAGANRAVYEAELATSVRRLMWEHGIGADCSGYVHHAFLASRGASGSSAARYGLGDVLASGLQAPAPSVFRKVAPTDARAGDVIVLTNGHDGTGHKVIVRSHALATGDTARAVHKALDTRGAVHLLEVDSSWGATGEFDRGGVGRATWAYDESSGRWATLVRASSGWVVRPSDKPGPYDHDLQGIYRPRTEP